ncbi:signal transduction histidine kinase [Actinomadura hallensis]|uniref:histidine kinase n=1 Tax=Actinomadura hallensis TaxID=337895 RepID=A0A543IN60_9ACTN|nr:sensor histidine kinase [Actinomadura hallensis]TQM72001.1 signal transduction histidine kinase [Actinomadura hallensis]HLV71537.1 sensor histidine kinase [Vulgatibacteraceae bacterium]
MDVEVRQETRLQQHLRAPWRGAKLGLLGIPAMLVGLWFITVISMITSLVGILLFPSAVTLLRRQTDLYRDLIRRWTGHRIERPYLPEHEYEAGAYGVLKRFVDRFTDPATWRDYLWTVADPVVVMFTAALPALFIVYGLWGFVLVAFGGALIVEHGVIEWYGFIPVDGGWEGDAVLKTSTLVLATAFTAGGFAMAPKMMDVYGRWGRLLLGPTKKSELALRVRHLTETRSEAVDASAAELRRIERDLHDGAQARLVAMGMTLGAIEHLLDKDPEKARLLLAETRQTSAQALQELRDLVRGIHPPVLADRGLGDAVKALALDHPLRPEVTVDLPGRADPPVESAAYFAVSEILTNAAKHSGASRVWIDLRYEDGTLRISVTDDGRGGARMEDGTGLRGIERRIGTFDGVLALSSPPGGPTIVTLELPCALSSPKTSPS